jgi:Raf kinase inhibitor-like YbhB/YbcL family protein
MFDPDAPTGSGWWHWAVYNIPAKITSLPQDAGSADGEFLPTGSVTLSNELREKSYQGASPPPGHGEHRYVFTLSALDVERLELAADATPAMLSFMIAQHVVARAQLLGVTETVG